MFDGDMKGIGKERESRDVNKMVHPSCMIVIVEFDRPCLLMKTKG